MLAIRARPFAELVPGLLQDVRQLPDVLLPVHEATVPRQRHRSTVDARRFPRLPAQLPTVRLPRPREVPARRGLVPIGTVPSRHAV